MKERILSEAEQEALRFCQSNSPEIVARQMAKDQEQIKLLEASLKSAEEMRTRFETEVGNHFDGVKALIADMDALKARAFTLIKP